MHKEGYIDMHTHFLPGVDDGAKSIEETMKLIRKDYDEGVSTIIFTPHYRVGMFETSPEEVERIYREIKPYLEKEFPDMSFYLGRELHATTDIMEILKENPQHYTLANTKYLLTEFSSLHTEMYIREKCYNIISFGLIPIIAHIERYSNIRDNFEFIKDLKKMGVKIQVNTDSVSGKDGFKTKRYCKKLIKSGLVDFVATDGHNMTDRVPEFKRCVKKLVKYGKEEILYPLK